MVWPETSPGPVGNSGVERNTDHGDVGTRNLIEARQLGVGSRTCVARNNRRVDWTEVPVDLGARWRRARYIMLWHVSHATAGSFLGGTQSQRPYRRTCNPLTP